MSDEYPYCGRLIRLGGFPFWPSPSSRVEAPTHEEWWSSSEPPTGGNDKKRRQISRAVLSCLLERQRMLDCRSALALVRAFRSSDAYPLILEVRHT